MNGHLSERQLEYYLRFREKLSEDEERNITEHLEFCHLCRDHLEVLEAYLNDVDSELSQPPGERDHTLVNKILGVDRKDVLPSKSLVKTYEAPLKTYRSSFSSKIVGYVRRHPVRTVTVTAASMAFIFVLFFMSHWLDRNPSYAEVENNVLQVFNSSGDVLWNLPADGIPEDVTSKNQQSEWKYLSLTNVDGNGLNEILITGNSETGRFSTGVLYCFNSDGAIQWEQSIQTPEPFAREKNTNVSKWVIKDFFAYNLTGREKPQLFAFANAGRWSPGVFYEVEPSTGEILQSYWHTGHLQIAEILRAGAGNDKIFLGAINDTYDRAALTILDPNNFNGQGTREKIFKSEAIPQAKEKYYITFKPSVLSDNLNNAPFNQVREIFTTNEGNLVVRADERLSRLSPTQNVSVYYVFDKNFEVLEVYGDDNFNKRYSELYEAGELDMPLNEQYWEKLKNSVRYWDGEEFIGEAIKVN